VPGDLAITARAGTRLAEVAEAVAGHGQQVIAEPPDLAPLLGGEAGAQTLGGAVAANLTGPRRVAWGMLRDQVLSLRAVNGRGEIVESGAPGLKSVTGLDICRLLAGSHGTLGVLTEVTLKLLPAAERSGSLLLTGLDPERGVAALTAALAAPFGVTAAAYLPAGAAASVGLAGATALLRIEDIASSVAYRTAHLRDELPGFGAAETLDDTASRAVWAAVRDAVPLRAAEGAIWRVTVRPAAAPAVVRALEAAFGARWFLDWGGGLLWIAGPANEAAHRAVIEAAQAQGGAWMLLRAPEALRASVAVIPDESPALARISASVKAAFDPKGLLNPGRLRAGL
jgi:glycolate oxidase FAD binding subunit